MVSCRDMGVSCDFVAKGETIDEIVKQVKDHAMDKHPEKWEEMKNMSDEEMKKMIESKVKEM